MQSVTFYFDPSCPFSWITSRWLHSVEKNRDVAVVWRPLSLALKNDEMNTGDDTTPHGESHRESHRVLRVMTALQQQADLDLGELYTLFGKHHFVDKKRYDDDTIGQILQELGTTTDILVSADDTALDAQLQEWVDEATGIVGDDIGVPTIVFTAESTKIGYFGPVLQSMPSEEDVLKLWDGLSQLATDKNFYELKRSRPTGGPDVASTASIFDVPVV